LLFQLFQIARSTSLLLSSSVWHILKSFQMNGDPSKFESRIPNFNRFSCFFQTNSKSSLPTKSLKKANQTSFDNNRTTKFSVKHIQTKSCHLMQQICNKNFYPFDKLNQFFVKPIDIIASIMKVTAAALSILSLLSTCWIHPVSALRNIRQNTEDGVVQQRQGKFS
jgi:hypothetical protein